MKQQRLAGADNISHLGACFLLSSPRLPESQVRLLLAPEGFLAICRRMGGWFPFSKIMPRECLHTLSVVWVRSEITEAVREICVIRRLKYLTFGWFHKWECFGWCTGKNVLAPWRMLNRNRISFCKRFWDLGFLSQIEVKNNWSICLLNYPSNISSIYVFKNIRKPWEMKILNFHFFCFFYWWYEIVSWRERLLIVEGVERIFFAQGKAV